MFTRDGQQEEYIKENYLQVTDSRLDDDHWDLLCDHCKVVRGFQVVKRTFTDRAGHYNAQIDTKAPETIYFHCPVCHSYKLWIMFRLYDRESESWRYYKVTAVPNDGLEEIAELPENPSTLRAAYKEAMRAMDANAHMAAAAMFRRALQVITRDILKAKPGNLGVELQEVVGKTYNGGVIDSTFSENAYIVKEAGNQGAHPDKDPDLLDFAAEDATALQEIFMEIVADLFVVPAAKQKAKDDFKARRKIEVPEEK